MRKLNRYKLDNVVILIPLKIDSEEKLINLTLVLDFLLHNFEVDIHLLEIGELPVLRFDADKHPTIFYEFVKDDRTVLHITKYRNYLLSKTRSDIIIHYNADVIVDPEGLVDIVHEIKDGLLDMGYPYNGYYQEVSPLFKRIYQKERSISFLEKYGDCMPLIFGNSIGGIFICNRSFYEKTGLENEKIVGGELDDKDRFYRSVKAGARYRRTNKPLYRLVSPVVQAPGSFDHSLFIDNTREYIKTLY